MNGVNPYPGRTGEDRCFYGACPVSYECAPQKVFVEKHDDEHIKVVTKNKVRAHIISSHRDQIAKEPPTEPGAAP